MKRVVYLDPSLGEEGTRGQDEHDVQDAVERVVGQLGQSLRRRDVVCKPGHCIRET
jgi:hypothetical protein